MDIKSFIRPAYSALRRGKERTGLVLAAFASGRRIRRYLATATTPRLHLGASDKSIPGWLNTDIALQSPEIVYLDCRKPFPVGDGVFDFVFCEHFIEHLTQEEGTGCMAEVFRTLKKGGVFRIATPDLGQFVGLLAADRTPVQDRYLAWLGALFGLGPVTPCKALNLVMHAWGHRYVYTQAELTACLLEIGFSEVLRAEVGQSRHAALAGIERHHEFAGDEANRFETMVVEAVK